MKSDPYSLNALEDIVIPEPVGLFPLAPVWSCVMGIALVWITYGLIVCWIRYRRNAYRRAGLKLIRELETATSLDLGLRGVDEVLKRVAMVAFSRERVAALWGADWIEFLRSSVDDFPIDDSNAQALAEVNFAPLPDRYGRDEYAATLDAANAWIRHHQRGEDPC